MSPVPDIRVRAANERPVREDGRHVLYWMIAARRTRWNHGLQRAVERARALRKPLVVLEALRCGHRWASERLHRFVIEGMRDNAERFAGSPVRYHAHVEPEPGHAKGLLAALAGEACVVVTDDFPCFFLPGMVESAARQLPVRLEAVDSNGLLPLAAAERVFPTAHAFRRFLQSTLPAHFEDFPRRDPLARLDLPAATLPREVLDRWRPPTRELLEGEGLSELPIDHAVGPGALEGGERAGARRLRAFLEERLEAYGEGRNHPDDDAASGLSPYLHFGHVSAHQVFEALADREGWRPSQVAPKATGSRAGWWRMSPAAESFLDELVTWRELGYNRCFLDPDYEDYDTLPPWSLATLAEHASDERPHLYTLEQLQAAETHDEVWNAAQRQLVREGRMHNYLRMLWGKKVLEWSPSPREALEVLVELNNRFALDGRNPNSYSGISWCLGRYDRPWGPERPIFGKVRYMSSDNTRRKLRLRAYLERFAE
jgi:deoxyribodipyrimidine photo-lyase